MTEPRKLLSRDTFATWAKKYERPSSLAAACEEWGKEIARSVDVLREGLLHESAIVREGAIYGLSCIKQATQDAESDVASLAADDPSPGVRSAAGEF